MTHKPRRKNRFIQGAAVGRWTTQLTAFGYNETAALYVAKKLCYDLVSAAFGVGISILLFYRKTL